MPDRYQHLRVTFSGPGSYRIFVEGFLEQELSDRLGGMRITPMSREDGSRITTLTGQIHDQAELMGILNALYEIHVPILSAELVDQVSERTGEAG
ncbi:MAG: hypothetical protein PVJ43_15260 [Gemmatimonadales bacterium]